MQYQTMRTLDDIARRFINDVDRGMVDTSSDAEMLARARSLIWDGWSPVYPAIDKDGEEVLPSEEAAVAWNIYGACERVIVHHEPWVVWMPLARQLRGALEEAAGLGSGPDWNPWEKLENWGHDKTRQQVVGLFDRAIEQIEKAGAGG